MRIEKNSDGKIMEEKVTFGFSDLN
jgi:hypothetical protein